MLSHPFLYRSRYNLAHTNPRQRGLAAVTMAAFVLAFSGLFILSIDGVRALQNKARFDEAVDIAALAVSSNALDNISTQQQKQIVKNYFNAYFSDISIQDNDISITSTNGTCSAGDASCIEGAEYKQYNIEVAGTFSRILGAPKDSVSFTDAQGNYKVAGGGIARRFDATSLVEAKDIIFVADFSGSMDYNWYGNTANNSSSNRLYHSRYIEALAVIDDIAETLEKYNDSVDEGQPKNTVGMAPFGKYTYDSAKRAERFITSPGTGYFRDRRWSYYYGEWRYYYYNYTLYSTADTFLSGGYTIPTNSSSSSVDYNNVELTTDISQFRSTVAGFTPSGYTASYKGLIRGAIMAAGSNATNTKRMIIILSDGDDTAETNYYKYDGLEYLLKQGYPYYNLDDYQDGSDWVALSNRSEISDNDGSADREMGNYFVDPDNNASTADGFCTYIRNSIEAQTSANGNNVSLQMIFIRFGSASLSTNHWIRDCMSSDDIYAGDEVESWDDVVEIIQNMVLDEGQYLYSP